MDAGHPSAWNQGVSKVTSEYLLFSHEVGVRKGRGCCVTTIRAKPWRPSEAQGGCGGTSPTTLWVSLTPGAGQDLHKVVGELAPLQLQDHVLDVPKAVRSREAQQHLPVPFQGDLLEVLVPVTQTRDLAVEPTSAACHFHSVGKVSKVNVCE